MPKRLFLIVLVALTATGLVSFERSQAKEPFTANQAHGATADLSLAPWASAQKKSAENTTGAQQHSYLALHSKLVVLLDNTLPTPLLQDKISGGKIVPSGNSSLKAFSENALAVAFSAPPQSSVLEKRLFAPAIGKGVGS